VRVIWGAGRGEEFGLMILVVSGAAVFEEAVRVIWGAGRGKEFGLMILVVGGAAGEA
jgi:hypothetical protein